MSGAVGPGPDALGPLAPLEDAPAAPGCPGHEAVWSAAAGELPPAEVERLLRHSLDCAACREAFRLAAEVQAEIRAEGATREADVPGPPAAPRGVRGAPAPRGRRARWFAAAAAAVLVVAVAGPIAWNARERTAAFRAADAARLEALTPDGAALPRDGFVLRWTEPARGTVYAVEVATERLDVLARVEALDAPELRLPPDRLAAVASGTTLLWRVDALLPDASRRSSPVYRVTLR